MITISSHMFIVVTLLAQIYSKTTEVQALPPLIMSPLCRQRWGDIALPLSAQSV